MTLNGTQRTLVEIMPPRYVLGGCDVWMHLYVGHANIDNTETGNYPAYFQTSEHLKRGVSLPTARAAVDVVVRRLAQVYPNDFPKQFTVQLVTVADYVSGDFKGMLYALMGAVLMLLLIACSNIANLLLARATAREKEIAIRTSLSDRNRVIRQLLVESFILSVAACIVGCVLAYLGMNELVAKLPTGVPFTPSIVITMNFRVLLFALGIAILTTLLCGLAPGMPLPYVARCRPR